ncbi:kinase domain-containing protein [Zalerion maritima]|uniref:Kinase domain-containing protein n=1 Tax=Zalerion maritima TaxID=339359 RepID=A0AAD5RM87_9PEZI|nr:kinase domain-containing protein [Zalerion maritima]
MWWDDQQIEAAVTRQFVHKHLLPEEIKRLDEPLDFGDGLTDGTYWSWIDEKAKRFFLILVDLGMPDQIFGIIDDSWDDSDLPIAQDQVGKLELTASRDERVDRKFYLRQFHFLLRHVEHGEHAVYQETEVVPVDVVDRRASRGHPIDKVTLPNAPGEVLCRRRIPLGHSYGCLSPDEFLHEINNIKNIQNEHLVSYWGSYLYQGYGYVLFTPASDFSLHTLLTTPPAHMKNMDKHQKRQLVVNWIHCLVDTLSFLHSRGLSHGNIKPSTIFFNSDNIFYSDFTRLNAEVLSGGSDRGGFDKEAYDYAAPEQWFKPGQSPSRRSAMQMTSPSTSPDQYTCSISRSDSSSSGTIYNTPAPQLNPQAADIFSLGCVILELITYMMKKQRSTFASHRGARHKTAGRGGAVLDCSFHKNPKQIDSWIAILSKEAPKKDDTIMKGVPAILMVVIDMLAPVPENRPSASRVEQRIYQILTEICCIKEPHCVHQYGGWDFGVGRLHGSPTLDTKTPTHMPTISRRPSSARRSVDLHRRTSSGGHGQGQVNQSWKMREKVRALQSPVYTPRVYQDPLAC